MHANLHAKLLYLSKMSKIDDWRLQGQERHLKQTVFFFKAYEQPNDAWDHDHCEFCGAKFSTTVPDSLRKEYVSLDNRWLCATCFNDFKEQLNLHLGIKK